MVFLPFFNRPEPGVTYVDTILASLDVGNVHIAVSQRGISCEVYDDKELEDIDKDEVFSEETE